jgi:hypothetical protein
MAETPSTAARRRQQQEEADRTPTRRVILKRERVLVIPDDGNEKADIDARVEAAAKALGPRQGPKPVEAWIVVAETTGDKRGAIEAYAGEPNTPTAKPGVYKAPSASAMRGGREYEKPPEPKVEAKDID